MRQSASVQSNAISNRLFDMPQLKASCAWVLKTDRVIVGLASRAAPVRLCSMSIWCIFFFDRTISRAVKRGPHKRNLRKREIVKLYACPGSVEPNCRSPAGLCLRQCPWNFECVIMYAWYECHYFIGTGTEAELLIELLMSRAVLL